ncbi:hypothetical protein [Micromonospora fulviviridis]|uniref:Uncharacterized protein n=1 Tax=Micromonospora fulviviridis TaxID=47860 RepID=A0ABV2VFF3_9ACTN
MPEQFPRCLTVRGSAEVPDGWNLWVAVLDPKQAYYFDKIANIDRSTRRWEAANVLIGSEAQGGQAFEIVPVLLNDEDSAFVRSATAYVGFRQLPKKAVRGNSISAIRSSTEKSDCGQ